LPWAVKAPTRRPRATRWLSTSAFLLLRYVQRCLASAISSLCCSLLELANSVFLKREGGRYSLSLIGPDYGPDVSRDMDDLNEQLRRGRWKWQTRVSAAPGTSARRNALPTKPKALVPTTSPASLLAAPVCERVVAEDWLVANARHGAQRGPDSVDALMRQQLRRLLIGRPRCLVGARCGLWTRPAWRRRAKCT